MRRVAAILMALALPSLAAAQPTEPPPDDYDSQSYVDSTGCAYQRVQIGARTVWGPRLDGAGQPVCGLAPSVEAPGLSDGLPSIPPNRRGTTPGFPEGGNYVQVGAFGLRENADRVVAQLQTAGLPVLRQDFPRGRGILRVLYAGPLADAETTGSALETVRAMGFADAFVWQEQAQ